jgi:hypothetical protein
LHLLKRIKVQARTVVLSQQNTMAFFRQYIAPLFIVLIFLVALLAVTARAFLPTDMGFVATEKSALNVSSCLMSQIWEDSPIAYGWVDTLIKDFYYSFCIKPIKSYVRPPS